MKQTIECTGRNVEKAIAEGLKQLNKTQDEVDIKILDEGGIFRKAKVELSFEDGKAESKQKYDISDDTPLPSKKEKKQEKTVVKEVKKEEKKTAKEEIQKTEKKQESGKPANAELTKVGCDFLKGLCDKLNITISITTEKSEDGTVFKINGDNVGDIIGHRGDTLNAIQYILSIITKNAGFKEERVFLDVENYKVRREESLISLGKRLCDKAIKIGKPVRLEPMSAYERRIIHTALQEETKIYTKSEGEEPRRYLVIIPKKDK